MGISWDLDRCSAAGSSNRARRMPNVPSIYEIRPTSAGPTPALIGDAQTQRELRKLAADYVERAALIESRRNPPA